MAERRALVNVGGTVSELPAADTLPGVQVLHGWPFPYEVSLSYSAANRQVTITPTGATFAIWVGGVKFVKTGAQTSTAHPEASDQHFLYYNTSGELEWSTTPWDMKVVSPVCEVYYDTIPADGIALNELHTYKRNPEWHESQHFAIGTFVRSGLEISGYTLNSDGDAAVTFQVAAGTIVDEDIEFAISTLTDGGPYTIVRRSGATGYTWDSTATVPYLTGATWIAYNQDNAGTWQMTEGANSRWVNYFVYATTALDTAKRIFLIPGQTLHTTLSSAQSESNASLNLTGLGIAEYVCVWKLTYATGNAYSATGKVRLVEVNRVTNTRGALSVSLTTTTHNLLTGRDATDAHPASAITNTPAGNIAATTVQAAINELDDEKQPIDATLTALAGVTTAANKLIYATASDTFATTDLSPYGRSLIDDADAVAARTTLGLGTAATMAGPTGAIVGTTDMQELSNKTATDLSLSAISATLHRSPNAITALFVYDTSKDSDPTWVDRCTHTSWYQETIYGKWLGAQDSESAARAVAGATTNDYYQLTTDGRFYALNAGSGVTQVYRGNKRAFPKLAAIVAEAASVTIYDLTEAGRPMFCRFIATATATITSKYLLSGANALAAINGKIYVGGTGTNLTGLTTVDFAKDMARLRLTSGYTWNGNLSTRNTVGGYTTVDAAVGAIVNATANEVATTVLPDAPVDPVTGLKVPTVVVATGGGISIIQNFGTVRNSSSTSAFTQVTITPQLLSAGRADTTWYYAATPGSLGASFSLSSVTSSAAPDFNSGNTTLLKAKDRSTLARTSSAVVQLLRNNEGTVTKGLAAKLSNAYNTGWMVGDIRRAYLASNAAGSLGPSTELVTNGTFDTGDLTGWQNLGGVASVVSGECVITGNGVTASGQIFQSYSTVAGRAYKVSIGYNIVSGNSVRVNYDGLTLIIVATSGSGTYTVTFTATSSTSAIRVYGYVDNGEIIKFDNISVIEAIPDRSYKAVGATINGTLTATEVNTGNDLVAYSGFSAANYIQEPYSADLDFGTGEWSCSAWVNVPATLPVESFPVVGSELVTNGDFSSGTTGWIAYSSAGAVAGLSVTDGWLRVTANGTDAGWAAQPITFPAGWIKVTVQWRTSGGTSSARVTTLGPGNDTNLSGVSGTSTFFLYKTGGPAEARVVCLDVTGWVEYKVISIIQVAPALIADRAHSSGVKLHLGLGATGQLTATAYDGTTTRTVTTTAAYNTATWLKVRANYTTDGRLAILVNGVEVAAATGTPLLTLNNSNAVLTIGNSYALDAPFPGSIALLKFSATVPTAEQAMFMYEQEKHLFNAGAKCVLPASTNVLDLAYDDATDTWSTLQATHEASWSGLVRTSTQTPSAGSFSKVSAASGVQLLGRTTTNPGVDVRMPAKNLRPKDMPKGTNQDIVVFDFDAVTSQTDFVLPVGYTARVVYSAGAQQREGSTKAWTRQFDGFRETVRFGTAPGNGVWVQIHAVKEVSL